MNAVPIAGTALFQIPFALKIPFVLRVYQNHAARRAAPTS